MPVSIYITKTAFKIITVIVITATILLLLLFLLLKISYHGHPNRRKHLTLRWRLPLGTIWDSQSEQRSFSSFKSFWSVLKVQ